MPASDNYMEKNKKSIGIIKGFTLEDPSFRKIGPDIERYFSMNAREQNSIWNEAIYYFTLYKSRIDCVADRERDRPRMMDMNNLRDLIRGFYQSDSALNMAGLTYDELTRNNYAPAIATAIADFYLNQLKRLLQ